MDELFKGRRFDPRNNRPLRALIASATIALSALGPYLLEAAT
jgi:hypothetical protein